jgi:MYXO-CTERM domain-containing protein
VLIVDGTYDSTDVQVKDALLAMHAAGVVTHVIGFGDALDLDQLDMMAAWGSGDLLDPAVAPTGDELKAAFQAILAPPMFDPCCQFWDCNAIGGDFSDTDLDPEETGDVDGSDTLATTDTGDDSETGVANDTGATSTTGTTSVSTTTGDDSGAGRSDGTSEPQPTTGLPNPTGPGDPNIPTTGGEPATTTSTGDIDDPSVALPDVGCSCDSARTGPPPALLLLALLARRRRRRA